MSSTSGVRVGVAAALVMAVVVAACTFTGIVKKTNEELEIEVSGTLGSIPPGHKPIIGLTVVVEGQGEFEGFSATGQAPADVAKRVDGTLIVAVEPKPPFGGGSLSSIPGFGSIYAPTQKFMRGNTMDIGVYWNPPEEPIDFETTQTEAELLAEHGLDTMTVGSHVGDLVDINRFVPYLDENGTVVGGKLDVTVHWNGNFGWPSSISDYPRLGYAFHNVADDPGQIGAYWALQVDGDLEYVLKWLADFGIGQIAVFGVEIFDEDTRMWIDVGTVGVQLDSEAGVAIINHEGRPSLVLPLLQ